VYIIAIVFIDNKHVLVAGDAGCEKSVGGVGVNHASGGIAIRVQVSRATGGWLRRCSVERGFILSGLLLCAIIIGCGGGKERRTNLCGARVHSDLV
jgi:hypothetical protein